jgi:hypothetical protein
MERYPHLSLVEGPNWPKSVEFFDTATSLDMIPDISVGGTMAQWLLQSDKRAQLVVICDIESNEPIHPAFTDLLKDRLQGRLPELGEPEPGILEISYRSLGGDDEQDKLLHFGFGITACFNLPELALIGNGILPVGELVHTRQHYKNEESDDYWQEYERLRDGLTTLLPSNISEKEYDLSIEQCLYLLDSIEPQLKAVIRGIVEMGCIAMVADGIGNRIDYPKIIDILLRQLPK